MTSEIDKFARQTYESYFRDDAAHPINEDITALLPRDIPDHDILAGGFPCQPFSIAGVSKKNSLGRAHGFSDPTKGTLFFNVKEILRVKRPPAFILENVKNLRGHDRGRTWTVVERSLAEIGYDFSDRILDAARIVPQHRERIFIVGIHRDFSSGIDWTAFWSEVESEIEMGAQRERQRYGVAPADHWPVVDSILEPHDAVDPKYVLTPKLWQYLQAYKAKHQAAGNGFGFGLVKPGDRNTRTISARYYKDGSEALISRGEGRPRRLTPRECARLQGFPIEFELMFDRDSANQPVSDTQAYKQFGNSVCVPIVTAITVPLAKLIASTSQMTLFRDEHSAEITSAVS